jgi:hypothetical protein
MKRIAFLAAAATTLALGFGIGCDKVPSLEDARNAVTGGVEQAGKVVENTTEVVKQATGGAGAIELQLDVPVTTSGCYAALYTFSDGRPSVVQITSYNDPAAESFPSVMLRAETSAKSPGELNGQKLSANAFVQQNPDGPVWSADAKPLELTISAADDTRITAEFSGTLEKLGATETKTTSGKLNGSFAK